VLVMSVAIGREPGKIRCGGQRAGGQNQAVDVEE